MIKELVVRELHAIADRLDAGTSELSEDDALELMDTLANVSLSQEESARYLNMNNSTFRKKVESGKIPRGHKRRGLTEKLWFISDLKKAIASDINNR